MPDFNRTFVRLITKKISRNSRDIDHPHPMEMMVRVRAEGSTSTRQAVAERPKALHSSARRIAADSEEQSSWVDTAPSAV